MTKVIYVCNSHRTIKREAEVDVAPVAGDDVELHPDYASLFKVDSRTITHSGRCEIYFEEQGDDVIQDLLDLDEGWEAEKP